MRSNAEAACEFSHKTFPRKRRRRGSHRYYRRTTPCRRQMRARSGVSRYVLPNGARYISWAAATDSSSGLNHAGLYAASGLVRPKELNRVVSQLFGLPGADVADLAVLVVVPALARDGVGDRLGQFVRAGGGERVERLEVAGAAVAAWVRHYRVEELAADVAVVAAEVGAGTTASLHGDHAGRQIDEEQGIGVWLRESVVGRDLVPQEMLDCSV